jgi:hypothetical protein
MAYNLMTPDNIKSKERVNIVLRIKNDLDVEIPSSEESDDTRRMQTATSVKPAWVNTLTKQIVP